MKRTFILLIAFLPVLFFACSKKEAPIAKKEPVIHPRKIQSDQPVKAATPEDPGPIATIVGPLVTWQKRHKARDSEQEPADYEPSPLDRPVSFEAAEPKTLIQTTFQVKKYSQVVFIIPPHQGHPRLQGDFESFTRLRDPGNSSGATADIDVMLLTDQELDNVLHGRPVNATVELDSTHSQAVVWGIPPTFDQPQQYHLVFANSAPGAKPKFVKAQFTVSFD